MPISPGVGGTFRSTVTSGQKVGVGGVWRTIEKMSVGVAGAWREFYANTIVIAPAISVTAFELDPADATASFRIDADGHWYTSATEVVSYVDQGSWVTPNANASQYSVRITRTGGSLTNFDSGPALGTFHNLGTDRTWTIFQAGVGTRNIIFTIDIQRDSDLVIVATGTLRDMTATVEV